MKFFNKKRLLYLWELKFHKSKRNPIYFKHGQI